MAVRIAGVGAGKSSLLSDEPALICSSNEIGHKFYQWRGASGRQYLHSIYSLVECPQLPMANYVLVSRTTDGRRTALRVGQTLDRAQSLNLAHIRRKAAQIGAHEIHVYTLSDSRSERRLIEADLQAGLFASLSKERPSDVSDSLMC